MESASCRDIKTFLISLPQPDSGGPLYSAWAEKHRTSSRWDATFQLDIVELGGGGLVWLSVLAMAFGLGVRKGRMGLVEQKNLVCIGKTNRWRLKGTVKESCPAVNGCVVV